MNVPDPKPVLILGAESLADHPGGLNRYTSDLVTALQQRAVLTRVVVAGSEEGTLPPPFVGAGRLDSSVLKRLVAYRRRAAEVGRDAILVDAHFALYALAPLLTTHLRRLPLVVHFQGPWAQESLLTDPAKLAFHARRMMEKLVYRRAARCITLSSAFKKILVEHYGVSPWRVEVIAPGVDLDRFSPAPKDLSRANLGIPLDTWVAVAPRRLVSRMGLDILMQAWAEVVKSLDRNCLLLIAGEGPMRSQLEDLAAGLAMTESVRFLGKVSDETLLDALRAADVCVVPSTSLEGFGLVVLESLACGTPVISSDAGGLPEVVGPLDSKLVVPAGDAAALSDCLVKAARQVDFLPSSDTCRTYAQGFDWKRAATRNIDLYNQARNPALRPRRLRVVYLDHCAKLSGAELALLRLLPAMPEVEAHVVLGEDGPLVAKLIQAGISVEVLPMAESARHLHRERVGGGRMPVSAMAHSLAYTGRLAYRLRRLRPDLVHTNSLKAAIYGGVAARLAGAPVIWHIRDSIRTDYLPSRAVDLVRSMGSRLPYGVIANSAHTMAALGWLRRPSAVIPSPLDSSIESADRAPQPNGGRNLRVGMLGRIAPWKGQDVFLEGFAKAFPSGDETAVIFGAPLFGEEQFGQELKQLADRLGLNGRIEFAGFQHNVADALSQLDVLVHASKTPEPFGQVVVEGMAAGLPVIATDAGGPAEIIEHGSNGILYPLGSSDALAEQLRRLADDAAFRHRLGNAGRETSRQFTPEAVASQVLAFYKKVLSGSKIQN